MDEFHNENGLGVTADSIIEQLDTVNEKVNAMRKARMDDPDSLAEKLLKALAPTVAGAAAGKLFSLVWNRAHPTRGANDEGRSDALLPTLAFSALSAAFVAIVSEVSVRGSQAWVRRRHRRSGL